MDTSNETEVRQSNIVIATKFSPEQLRKVRLHYVALRDTLRSGTSVGKTPTPLPPHEVADFERTLGECLKGPFGPEFYAVIVFALEEAALHGAEQLEKSVSPQLCLE